MFSKTGVLNYNVLLFFFVVPSTVLNLKDPIGWVVLRSGGCA
jgi:hypothetical protein